ncbi:MAG: CapA family protein [Algoriphagus sp.]|nr:CapA family protein [Algoriphagus sp.]
MKDLLTIGFAGDVMLGRTLDRIISERGYRYPWGDVLPLMRKTDLNIINLETALTHSEDQVFKTFNFKATPYKVQTLIEAKVTVANLANNHVLDFDQAGLIETLETLDNAGIKYVGAGLTLADAEAPVILLKNGIRIGVLGITDNEPTWKAGIEPGTNYIDIGNENDRNRILLSIGNLRKETDIVIVSIHWGPNMVEEPFPEFIRFAHEMIDHGANLIHGHSAHIFQGMEKYKSGLIMYDTGDFVDDYVVEPELRNDLSAFFVLTADKTGLVSLSLIPVRIVDYQATLAEKADFNRVIARMQKLSADFDTSIDDKGNIFFR